MINRTAEKVLAIIAAVFTALGMALLLLLGFFFNVASNDLEMIEQLRAEIIGQGTFSLEEVDMYMEFFNSFGVFIWIGVAVTCISLVLTIIGLVKLRSQAKVAGTLFIVAGLINGILSLTSILLYIAGIMCITKKPPTELGPSQEEQLTDQSNWMN